MLRGTEYLGEHLRLRLPLVLTLTVFGIIVRLNTYSFKSFKEAVCLETTRMSSDIKGPARPAAQFGCIRGGSDIE